MSFYISEQHQSAIELAQKSAIALRLHSDSTCTACQYLHRVYRFFEQRKQTGGREEEASTSTSAPNFQYDIGIVVSTCLVIACKATENLVRLSDLISTVHQNLLRQQPESTEFELAYSDPQQMSKDHKYWKLRDSVTHFELFILRILQFNLTVDLPHRFLIFYLKSLGDWLHDEAATEELFLLAWSLLNDYVCNHPKAVEWPANQVALACIELAITSVASAEVKSLLVESAKSASTTAEESGDKGSGRLWYNNFDRSLKPDVIRSVIDQILDVCTTTRATVPSKSWPPPQIEDNKQQTKTETAIESLT